MSRLEQASGRGVELLVLDVLDVDRIFAIALNDLDDLLTFCQQLVQRARG